MTRGHTRGRSEPQPKAAQLLDAYQPVPGAFDEMVDQNGNARPAWAFFVNALERLGTDELARRFGRADQYLRDAGVYYRVYGRRGESEREWPLAHLPLLIAEDEWNGIASGLVERADLFEKIIADIYGEGRLVREGLIPPGLIAQSPEFLRPMVGAKPAGGHFLHFCAFELGRDPTGRWRVLGDRTQAPSGAGFALENRVATTRALSDIYGDMEVHRLAGFFRGFRDALMAQAEAGSRAAILTPGPLNETYFEHAYIARYLGMMLLEGEDLTVAGGKLMVRTVSGLKPVGVLWRRLDAAFADPLEFKPESRIGTPGLAEALRCGSVVMVNALGSGILETRALLAFLPAIARALNGRDIALPSIPTWWCGNEEGYRHVRENLERMMVGPANSTRLAFEDEGITLSGADLDGEARDALLGRLEREGASFVAQEAATLSTTPVYVNGWLEPRPAMLRVYLARTADGWTVMPGGFARIGYTLDPTAIAMQHGGQASDVWVVSDRPVPYDTLLSRDDSPRKNQPGSLPSRAAENLLWLGRYVERAEETVRMLRAFHVRLAETSDPELPLLAYVRDSLAPYDVDVAEAIPDALIGALDSATYSAGRIRDRFSPDGWLALRDLSKTVHEFAERVTPGDDAARAMTVVLRKLAGFSGLLHENMYRFTGWRFLEIGRRIERGMQIARSLGRLTDAAAPEGALDMMLEIGDSVLTHRRQYNASAGRRTVLDLLALDALNPRSLIFQLDRLKTEVDLLPGGSTNNLTPAAKSVLRLHTELAVKEPTDLSVEALDGIVYGLADVYDDLARYYFA